MSAPQLAYEHNGARVSREQFYAIACDPRRSVAVEACAGAGKTWMLVSRILRALLDGAQPHEILAITFTKKAAGEMRERLHQWLAQFAACAPAELREALVQRGVRDPSDAQVESLRGLFARLLASGRPVQIRTFHSWFAALLRNAPVAVLEDLRLPVHYELLEDDSEAVDLVWRRFFTAVSDDDAARADYQACVAAHGRYNTQKALLAALSKRVEFGLADAQGRLEGSVRAFGEQFPELAGLAQPGDAISAMPALRERFYEASRALGRASAPTFRAKGEELERAVTALHFEGAVEALLTKSGDPRKFNDKLAGIEQVREAQALVQRLCAACDQHEAWLHHQRMTRLARILIDCFGQLKRDRGWVDMNDVERAALTMLSDPVLSGWVQERLDARTRHLLIDEFQDTNPLQWQALHAWLSGYAGAGGDAPSVFIVGDPKQSIYRFRRAEPRVFKAAQAFLAQALGGDLLSCDHTHRNARKVIGLVNGVMGAAQAEGSFEGYREHTTQSAAAGAVLSLPQVPRGKPQVEEVPASAPDWRDSLVTPRELPEERLVSLECRQAAAWVAAMIAAGTPASDIMVLARRRDRLAAMEDELRALHIPAQQPEKTDLCDAPEVQDLVALLDVLVSTTHDLSLARALRSPLFGVGDEALVELALASREARAEGRSPSWYELLQQRAGEQTPLGDAALRLAAARKLVERLPPHDALQAIYASGDVVARFAAAAPPALRRLVTARLGALLAASLEVEGGRYLTPYAFVRALKAGGIKAPSVSEVEAVQLLTVHGAKGLEAPFVLLLDTDAQASRAETMGVIVDWPGEEAVPRRFAFLASESHPCACLVDAVESERVARQREELNGLYVALTRAREGLVLSSVQPHISNPGSWWKRVQPLCEPIDAPAAAGSAAQVRERLITLLELPRIEVRAPAQDAGAREAESERSRFGQAVHRLLEQWQPSAGEFKPSQVRRMAREFDLTMPRAQEAARMASRIATGEGAWAWDPRIIDWHANEVPLQHEGQALRLDRLVRRADDGQWWVLDYKSNFAPQEDASLMAQMRGYAAAVREAYPGETVRVAFLTGQGRLVPVE